jgi:ribosomal protein L37E
MARHIKCPKCGEFNTNREHCDYCGTLLFYEKRRALAFEKSEKQRLKKERLQAETNPSFFETYENHRFLLVRVLTKVLHSIWLAFLAIGGFIAWLITAIAA